MGEIDKRSYTVLGGRNYHDTRLKHPAVRFSLKARTEAISKCTIQLFPKGVENLLDIGSADGLMATGFKELIPALKNIYVIDLDFQLLEYNPFTAVQADSCKMPFAENSFDVITAAALIEHLHDPRSFLKECFRILKPSGGLFLTCPTPFFEWLATQLGYLKDSGHVARYSLSDLGALCKGAGFSVALKKKFMPSPILLPRLELLESVMRAAGLSFLFLNQVLGCLKEVEIK